MGIGWRSIARLLALPLVLHTILQGVLMRNVSRTHETSMQEAASFQAPPKETFTNTNRAHEGATTAHIGDPSDSKRIEKANTQNNISLSQVKKSVSGSAPAVKDAYKALLWLFPGSGEHYLECALDPSASGLLLLRYPVGSNTSSNTQEMKKDVMLGSMIPRKRVILVRHPLDAIWERYQHAQTGSLTRYIQEIDFHSRHFELQALAWAKEFRDGKPPPLLLRSPRISTNQKLKEFLTRSFHPLH
jgi:hypothetical protein